MYILKNALTSIARNRGRNLLIGIIILVISCAISVTLAINNSSSSLIKSYEKKYEVEATIGINRENMMTNFNPEDRIASKEEMQEAFNRASLITISDIENYADSSYVKDYYYTMSVGVNASNLEKYESTIPNGKNDRDFSGMEDSSDFTLKGYSSINSMQEFIDGSYTITGGEVNDDFSSNYCLINNELAILNELAVGDKITIIDSNDSSKTYELVVSGIYKEKEETTSGINMFSNSINTIITNANVVKKMSEANENLNINTSPTFILTSSDAIESFQAELTKKELSEYLTIVTNLDQVNNATSAISNVKTFAIAFLIITIIIGTIVLLVINMINIRERKYEIGVLRTIGMKKSKVCLQFLSELMIVSFIALILGASVGAIISVPVSNSLLKSEISSSQQETVNIRENFGRGDKPFNDMKDKGNFKGVAIVSAFDSIDAVVDFKVLLELLGLGLLITLISGTSAIVSIQKFSPLTILKERS